MLWLPTMFHFIIIYILVFAICLSESHFILLYCRLVVAPSRHSIRVAAWAAVVTWEVVVLDLTTEVCNLLFVCSLFTSWQVGSQVFVNIRFRIMLAGKIGFCYFF